MAPSTARIPIALRLLSPPCIDPLNIPEQLNLIARREPIGASIYAYDTRALRLDMIWQAEISGEIILGICRSYGSLDEFGQLGTYLKDYASTI